MRSIFTSITQSVARLITYPLTFLIILVSSWGEGLVQAQTTAFTNAQIGTSTGCDWPYSAVAVNPSDGKVYSFWRKGAGADVTYNLIRFDGVATGWSTVSTFTSANGSTASTKVPNFEGATDYVGLAIDGSGKFHVVFQGYRGSGTGSTRGVWYGLYNGTAWTFNEIQTFTDPNGWKNTYNPVIDVDASNHPSIAFRLDDVNGNRTHTIRFYQNTGSGWGSGQDAFSQTGVNNEINALDLAIDGNGKAHIAFQRETDGSGLDGGLWYTTNSSGSWASPTELVHGTQAHQQGNTISIDTDASNKVHIVHSDYQNVTNYVPKLYYTTNVSGSFQTSQINGNLVGTVEPHALQINSAGDKFLTYNYTNNATNELMLKYAYQLHGTTGTWNAGTIYSDDTNSYGDYFSGLLTTDGRIIVLYDFQNYGQNPDCSASPRQLYYATATIQTAQALAPTVTTSSASNVTGSSATLGGNVTADGGATVTERGIVYLLGTGDPTTANTKVAIGSGTGVFSQNVTGLSAGTTYSVRAYATNSVNTSYGSTITFTTTPNAPVISSPTNGTLLNTRTPAYVGTAQAGSTVTLYVDNNSIGTATATGGNFSLTQPSSLSDGSHTVYAKTSVSGVTSPNSTTTSFRIDATPPSVSLVSAVGASGSSTSTSPIAFTATFSESVTNFTANKIQVTNGTVSGLTNSGTTYSFTVTPTTGGGVSVSVLANVVSDAAGNGNTASGPFSLTYLAPQTITFGPLAPVPYGSASFPLTATASSGLSVSYVSSDPTVASVSSQGIVSVLKAGSATITASQPGNSQYAAATSVPQGLTINPTSLTITANNLCQAYGSARPTLTATYSGFVHGDTQANLSPQAAVSTTAPANAPSGSYTITASGAASNNYTFVYLPGILTVVQPSVVASGPLTCAVTSISLTAGGGSNYRLSNAQGTSQSNTTGYFVVSANGLYSLTATAPNGCSATTTTMVMSNTTAPTVSIQPMALTGCAGQSIQLTAVGGDTYQWSTGQTTAMISVTATGTVTYSVTATTIQNGCSASASQSITIKPLPSPPSLLTAAGQSYPFGVSSLTVSQNTSSVILVVSGCPGGSISWNGGNATTLAVSTAQLGTQNFQAICTTNGCSSPAAGASVTVVPITLGVLYRDADYGQTTNNIIKPYLQLSNAGNDPIPYSQITVRYWLTPEGAAPANFAVYYAPLGTVAMQYVALGQARQGALGYVEYSFPGGGNLPAQGNSGVIENGIQKADGSNFNEMDDYSYMANYADYMPNAHITAYRTGADGVPVLFWGQEPASISTQTAITVYSAAKDGPTTSQIQTRIEVRNEGNTPVAVSSLKVRYYFTSDNGQPANVYIDYADIGASNVAAQVVQFAGVSGADGYVELSFPGNTQTLAPQSSLGAIDFRIVRSDYGLLDQTNDYSYMANYGNVGLNNHITAYLSGMLAFGMPPTGAPARAIVVEPSSVLKARVLGNPVVGSSAQVEITGAGGQAVSLKLVDFQGRAIHEQRIEQAGEVESVSVPLGSSRGTLLLKVSMDSQQQSLKLLRP